MMTFSIVTGHGSRPCARSPLPPLPAQVSAWVCEPTHNRHEALSSLQRSLRHLPQGDQNAGWRMIHLADCSSRKHPTLPGTLRARRHRWSSSRVFGARTNGRHPPIFTHSLRYKALYVKVLRTRDLIDQIVEPKLVALSATPPPLASLSRLA